MHQACDVYDFDHRRDDLLGGDVLLDLVETRVGHRDNAHIGSIVRKDSSRSAPAAVKALKRVGLAHVR